MSRPDPAQPRDRNDFQIAIICALPLEASAVGELFDKRYDPIYGKATEDPNAYSTGVIGAHNVVLVHMPNMGKIAAAATAASLRASFPGIRLALVVGICGGVPFGKHLKEEILLGDVVISEGLVQYDFGRQYPDNRFLRKDTPRDNLPRPGPEIRSTLAKLQTEQGRTWLQQQTFKNMEILQQKSSRTAPYPGAGEDKLFASGYRHKHQGSSECAACVIDDSCNKAFEMNCEELGCSEQELVTRSRMSQPFEPRIHFGLVASGDTVMKSGDDRDAIAARDGVIAFEMEGAGVWEAFPNVLVIKAVCDYADSHKSKRWQAYAAATAACVARAFLEDWRSDRKEIRYSAAKCDNSRQRERETKVLRELYTSTYRDGKDRNQDRIPGTCEWFVGHDLFRQWRESESSRLLWVSADPGCGKSVLAKHLVDSVLPSSEHRTTCYFFFKDDSEDQRTSTSALCCILHQLFFQRRHLLSEAILQQFEAKPGITSSFGELWDILIRAAQDETAGEIVCLVDALDECEERGRSQLVQALCDLYSTDRDFKLKFLLTSRGYPEIRQLFHPLERSLPVIHLSGESDEEVKKISQEIDIFIKAKVQDISDKMHLSAGEQSLLLEALTRVPNRTYLWVYLTLDVIESNIDIDQAEIAEVTSTLPKTVNDAYERILSRSKNVEKTKRVLHIVVGAARPLTLDEMNVALALKDGHRSYKDLDLKAVDRLRTVLRGLCRLFVVVVDSRIYLLHQTAKEFLVQKAFEPPTLGGQGDLAWEGSLAPRESHRILAEICIGVLLFTEFNRPPPDEDKLPPQYIDSHVFLEYSAKHWVSHYHYSDVRPQKMLQALRKLCDSGSTRFRIWSEIYWPTECIQWPTGFTSLTVASFCGIDPVVEHMLRTAGTDLDARDIFYGRSALFWAAMKGHVEIVTRLLKGIKASPRQNEQKGATVDLRDDNRSQTPLSSAAENGHTAVVELLLDHGADLESRDKFGLTPLSHAVTNGHEEVINLLLERGADFERKSQYGHTPLLWAAQFGRERAVKLFLDRGANIELRNESGMTLLSVAARYGREETVRLLVDEGADLEARDEEGQTALSWAAQRGEKEVAQLLIDEGADLESRDNDDQTPLLRAAWGNQREVVKLLLESGADLEYALSWTREGAEEEMEKLLLEESAKL